MTRDEVPPRHTTHLRGLVPASASVASQPPTGTLDTTLPWVMDLRIVGTATTIQVKLGPSMVLGRDDPEHDFHPEIDLTAYDAQMAGVSRKHAIILSQEGRVSIKDLNSANGTRLNGFQLVPGMEYKLEHGDEIMLGELGFQVQFAVSAQKRTDTQSARSAPADIPAAGKGKRILIIEDDTDVSIVFRLGLEKAGYNVMVAANAATALNAFTGTPPDAIVTDLDLPDLNGVDLIQYVRRNENGRHIPVIVVSAATGGFQMSKALDVGADLFLGKPLMIEDLIKAVNGALKTQ